MPEVRKIDNQSAENGKQTAYESIIVRRMKIIID